jgi:DNA-directed RNA polymerase specialized sigma subunit
MVFRMTRPEDSLGDKMSSSLEKALERFDKLSEKQLSEIARRMIRGAAQLERKAKTRGLQKT